MLTASLRTATRAAALPARRVAAFSTSVRVSSEGAPSGHGQSSFNKREKAEEERYVREAELEKLKALKKSIEASKARLQDLEGQHKELEASIKSGDVSGTKI
ncbi:hypothetical protein JCM8115_003414 [Rhodotorula mucilaginosa]|uniref:ATPase inhibitor, mitochondrial n=1 Tax=Rhodotorula mucilaginosa TaxID=5537 RepID=A0A9P6W7T5_RHOMI|nr:hypothetical protein C6P46_004882 [Rhodotorula mucilaginosa]TKA51787.1 hypothetical protein B0A53_05473 [Rhodotorula sp. CCFEE 5036]